jgi:CBS domain-containing protein
MAERGVHAVVVLDDPEDAQSLWGVISDLDLIAAASVRELHEQSAGGTAASAALTITPSETLQRASQLMTEHAIAHLIVVGADNRPLGVLSTLDVARALTGRDNRT